MKNKLGTFSFVSLVMVLMLLIIAVVPGFATPAPAHLQDASGCPPNPNDGNWTKIDSKDLSSYPVYGADEYCFKAGDYVIDHVPSRGFGQDGACTKYHIERCGLSHWAYHIPGGSPTPTFTPTSTSTDEPTPTSTDEPSPTPTDQPTVTPVPTDEPTPTSTPVPFCWVRTFGELFHLIGPNGESGWLASYQTWDQAGVKPPDGVSGSSYIIPRTEAQQRCLGFIAKDAPFGMAITIDCTGHVNITTTRCEGGGTCVAVGEGTVNGYTGESEGHIAP